MIDIELIRSNPEVVRENLISRNKSDALLNEFIQVDAEWKKTTAQAQDARARQKQLGAEKKIEEARVLKDEIKGMEDRLTVLEQKRYELLLEIPNVPFADVPRGKDESENVEIKRCGIAPSFDFEPKDHLDLGEALGIIDVKKAAEVSGSRFGYLKGKGAMLEIGLVHFAMDLLSKEGFEAVIPPVMIKPEVYERMGRLTPSQREERYRVAEDDLYLIGSAEHTMGPLHMDETFESSQLPKKYVGFSSAFRREAGSYGKDTRGIFRMHQFDKVEMYAFADPKHSEEEHRFLLSMQEKIFSALELPYRVVAICTGDMGPTDARQFDIEAWIPTQNTYREVGSCSNTTDYQTRGIRTKIKREGGETELAHALNATGIAIGRTIMALMENHQQKDGSIRIPSALHPYLTFTEIK